MSYRSIIIGHITNDINTDCEGNTEEMAGGAILYCTAAATALGHEVAAVTKLPVSERARVLELSVEPDNIFCTAGEAACDMVNTYLTPDKERRNSVCESAGTPFTAEDIPDKETDVIHFAGLVYGDFDSEMIIAASEQAAVAVDLQGFLRHVNDDGTMELRDWEEKEDIIPYITYLKADAAEAEILTGTSDRREAAKIMYEWGADEIVITHNSEVLVFDGDDFYTCPIRSRNLSGRTGRGDTTFASYVCERQDFEIDEALLIATATVSLKMETPGPFNGTREDVKDYINEFYRDCID